MKEIHDFERTKERREFKKKNQKRREVVEKDNERLKQKEGKRR